MASGDQVQTVAEAFVSFLVSKKGLADHSKLTAKSLRTLYNLDFKHSITNYNQAILPLASFTDVHEVIVQEGLLKRPPDPLERPEKSAPTITKPLATSSKGRKATMSIHLLPFDKDKGYQRDEVVSHIDRRQPDILATINTNLNHISAEAIGIQGYNIQANNSKSGKQGIVVYCKNSADLTRVHEFESDIYETVWLKLTHADIHTNSNGEKEHITTYVGNVVRQTAEKSITNFLSHLTKVIDQVTQTCPEANIFIQGDFSFSESHQVDEVDRILSRQNIFVKTVIPQGVPLTIVTNIKKDIKICQDPKHPTFLMSKLQRIFCTYCNEAFRSSDSLLVHRESDRHRRNFCFRQYMEKRSEYAKSQYGMMFGLSDKNIPDFIDQFKHDSEASVIYVTAEPGRPVEFKVHLKNWSTGEEQVNVILKSIEILGEEDSDVKISDDYDITKPPKDRVSALKTGVRVLPGRKLTFTVWFCKAFVGQFRIPIMATVRLDEDLKSFRYMMVELVLKINSRELSVLEPEAPFLGEKAIQRKWKSVKGIAVPAEVVFKFDKGGVELGGGNSVSLANYKMPADLKKLFNFGFRTSDKLSPKETSLLVDLKEMLMTGLTLQNYEAFFELLLYAEEHQMELDIRNYDMENVNLEKKVEGRNVFFLLEVPGLAENRPSILKGDKIYILEEGNPNASFEGVVFEVLETKVKISLSQSFTPRYIAGMKFSVQFTFNRFPMRTMHRAVKQIRKGCSDVFFPVCPRLSSTSWSTSTSFFNRMIEKNEEQKIAVSNIISGNLKGAPYIVFGPPGTGKTVTIVEAMKQIYKKKSGDCRILACAPSNSAADLIAQRLMDSVSPSDILRLYAASREERLIPADLKPISNFGDKLVIRRPEDIKKFKVVVVTLVNAGRLVSMGIPKGHFEYIFIDEAGHASEPETAIPIAGLLDPVQGHLVLTGDPKQLGPILRSRLALSFGLQTSFLERVMNTLNFTNYQREPGSENYNPQFVTKLRDNFRSHEALLSLPSNLFYLDELRPKADPFIVNSMLNWDRLPKEGFPLIFHSVSGEDKREMRSPSFFNVEEACVVIDYVHALLTEPGKMKTRGKDIGIITPYRRQVHKIKDALNTKFQKTRLDWKGIKVGSTEEFQGQERKVIILSTVRSREEFLKSDVQHKLGFLKNPKRFNVAITRAKALLIVIGNSRLLQRDSNWRRFIEYAYSKGGYTGAIKYEPSNADDLSALETKFKTMGISGEKIVDQDITEMELQEAPEWRADF